MPKTPTTKRRSAFGWPTRRLKHVGSLCDYWIGGIGRNLTRRWEKNPTDAGAQRPGVVSLRRMLYLVVWQMAGVLYISDLDEVDWNRRHVVPRDELKPPVSPFLKVVGGGPLAVPHGPRSRPLPLRRTSSSSHCASWGSGTTLVAKGNWLADFWD